MTVLLSTSRRGIIGPVAAQMLYLVKQVEQVVRAHLERIVAPYGLTALQYTALTVLERSQGMTVADLARRSFVRPQTMAHIVALLEANRLIERTPDTSHGRKLLLSLTPAGRSMLRELAPAVAQLEARMLEGVTPAAIASTQQTLTSSRAQLERWLAELRARPERVSAS